MGIHWFQAIIFFLLGTFFGPMLWGKIAGRGKSQATAY